MFGIYLVHLSNVSFSQLGGSKSDEKPASMRNIADHPRQMHLCLIKKHYGNLNFPPQ